MDNLISSRASQSRKLRDRLNIEKPNLSDAVLSSDVMKNVENSPPASSRNKKKQQVGRKPIENEELVKYMSVLPSYLEKGENLKEKALNVGVLDWRRLEKWQYNHKQMSYQSSKYSPSRSNTSSFFSTDGSSTRSSRGHSCSPAQQDMHRRTLQSHLNASPKGSYSEGVKPVVENVGKFQDLKVASSNPLKGQQSIFRMYQSFSKNQSEIKPKECKWKDKEPPNINEIETSQDFKNCGVASQSKGKTKIQDGECTSGLEELQEQCCDVNQNYNQRSKTAVLLPRDDLSCPCDLAALNGRRSTEASRKSFAEGYFPKELYNADAYSEIPHSCPLPCEADNAEHLQIKQPSSVDVKNIKFSSEPSQPSVSSVKISISPSRGKNLDEKSPKVTPLNSTINKPSQESELEKGMVEASKSRNPSPTRRFSIGLGRIGRTSRSKDSSAALQLSSEHVTAKFGPEKAVGSSCLENSINDKPNNTSRSQSSPLRRLLDPLLKPKAVNSHHSAEPSEKNPTSTVRACKSSTAHPVKVKLDLKSCKTVGVDGSHRNEKHKSSTVQALFQIAIKNGLPLFTFADDNNSNILAATVRKGSVSRKDGNCWIYTFFSVHEVKKKSGWINQGSKGKSRGYVPNVVAQMTVSDAQFSKLVRPNSVGELGIREFVLFAVDLREADSNTSDLQSNDELAAIVVKFPKETPTRLNKDGQQSDHFTDPSVIGLRESLPEVRGYPNSGQNEENGSSVRSQVLLSTTVILPCGVHGLPSKGEPSPLIERWNSGGLCDCGGWDMGCRTRVLASQTKLSRRSSSSSGHHAADRFELFSQGEALDDNMPFFSLSPFKDGIFSVEFNSSLSFLQAFSICIAVLNSRKSYELSELSTLFEENLLRKPH